MAKKNTTELAEKPDTAISTMPQMNQAELTEMYGDLGKEHVSIPRLVILESLSPEVGDGLGKPGEFFVKGLNNNLGSNPLELVVLMRSFSRISWKDISEGGGIVCQAVNGKEGVGTPGGDCNKCPNKDWNGKIQPLCDVYENFIVVLRKDLQAGEAFPMAISGSRTRLKGLKDFNTILMQLLQKRRPLFSKSYLMKSIEKNNPKIPGSKYRVFQFNAGNDNQLLPDAEQTTAYDLYKTFSGRSIIIDQDAPSAGSEPESAPGKPGF